MALHKILCKSGSNHAKGGLRGKQDLGFPFNCYAPESRDGICAAGVNTVSASEKILREEISIYADSLSANIIENWFESKS